MVAKNFEDAKYSDQNPNRTWRLSKLGFPIGLVEKKNNITTTGGAKSTHSFRHEPDKARQQLSISCQQPSVLCSLTTLLPLPRCSVLTASRWVREWPQAELSCTNPCTSCRWLICAWSVDCTGRPALLRNARKKIGMMAALTFPSRCFYLFLYLFMNLIQKVMVTWKLFHGWHRRQKVN